MERLWSFVRTTHRKIAISGAAAGLAVLTLAAGPLAADNHDTPPAPTPSSPQTHEQMHQMMDAVHGPGTSQRMHEAMGPEGEQIMEQCVSMMNMMQSMQGMMGGGTSGMDGQNSQAMQGMMGGIAGQ